MPSANTTQNIIDVAPATLSPGLRKKCQLQADVVCVESSRHSRHARHHQGHIWITPRGVQIPVCLSITSA
eukprot:2777145-Rhodomonas_salina.6